MNLRLAEMEVGRTDGGGSVVRSSVLAWLSSDHPFEHRIEDLNLGVLR